MGGVLSGGAGLLEGCLSQDGVQSQVMSTHCGLPIQHLSKIGHAVKNCRSGGTKLPNLSGEDKRDVSNYVNKLARYLETECKVMDQTILYHNY